jgi:hypothetical protein
MGTYCYSGNGAVTSPGYAAAMINSDRPAPSSARLIPIWLCLLAALALSACSPRQLIVTSLADELAGQSQGAETDPELARDAAPFYLKLSEAVLAQQPEHAALAEGLAARMTEYAYAFVAFEADRIESEDTAAAEHLRRRAAGLYQRARNHAVKALELRHPGFLASLADQAGSPVLPASDAGLAYWAAAAWGSWIALAKDDPEVVADLPLVVRLAAVAEAADPDWGEGALGSLRATLEAGRPGGDQMLATRWFDAAIARAQGQSAAVLVAKAESIALPAGDREAFETLLRQALAVRDAAGSPRTLQNEVMRRRAAWLLEQAPDLF